LPVDELPPNEAAEPPVAEALPVAPSAAPPAAPIAAAAAPEAMPILPPIDELTAESDFTAFLAENVPESLRRAALRKLWRSDPVFANLDGLVDYGKNYHLADTTITAAQTAYRVGLGYLDEAEKVLQQVDKTAAAIASAPAESASAAAPSSRAGDGALGNAGDGALVNSDAAMDEPADPTRQTAAIASDTAAIEPPGKSGQ
jgi:hypothetical protein